MKTSVIVPTRERPQDLKRMLESVIAQSCLPDEVVIVDQSAGNDSHLSAQNVLQQRDNIRFKYIRDTGLSGSAQARNRAIERSEGQIIFLLDDDVVLEKEFIKNSLAVYEKLPDVDGVGGVITNVKWMDFKKIAVFDKIFKHGIFKDVRKEMYINHESLNDCVPTNKLSGGCSSYKRDVLGEAPFDEALDHICDGYAFGEDVELSLRLSKKHKFVITPNARLAHYSGTMKTHRSRKEQVFYLEVASWSYIFKKNFKFSLVSCLCYVWLVFGWFLRSLKGVLLFDFSGMKALLMGLSDGLKLRSKKSKQKVK